MRIFLLIILLTFSLFGSKITPSVVYSQVMLISDEIHFLLKYYNIKDKNQIVFDKKTATLKPRNVWQLTYEIMLKINMLRNEHNLPTIVPVNMVPVLHLNPDLVYEQTQRVLAELKIFETREGIKAPIFKEKRYKNKTPLDVFNKLMHISKTFDLINEGIITPSYVFGEQIRIFDDLTLILYKLNIQDNTIPKEKKIDATPKDTFDICMNVLNKIKQLQIGSGIEFVDFSEFKKNKVNVSDVYSISEMIIAELQTIKAYLGIKSITAGAVRYYTKTPAEVSQLVSWNLRKLKQIHSLSRGK